MKSKMTAFDYKREVSEMLNSVGPSARKAIESDLIYIQAKREGDWAGVWKRVYHWLYSRPKE